MIHQLKDVKKHNLQKILELEMDVLHTVIYMEMLGVWIDPVGCKVFQKDMSERADQLLKEILKKLNPVW